MASLFSRVKIRFDALRGVEPRPPLLRPQISMILEEEQRLGRQLRPQEVGALFGWSEEELERNWHLLGRELPQARADVARYEEECAIYEQYRRQRGPRASPERGLAEAPLSEEEQRTAEVCEAESVPGSVEPDEAGRTLTERLEARRRALLEQISFELPVHRRFLTMVKNLWRVVGPVAFVVFTVGEVFYFLQHFLPTPTLWSEVLLWGISLLIEVPFMIATYDQAERRARQQERRAQGGPAVQPGDRLALLCWIGLAIVNVCGQVAFLAYVTHAGYRLDDPATLGLWVFILVRVGGVILGDSYTAFFLLEAEPTLERELRRQQQLVEGEARLAAVDRERLLKEAEARQAIRRVELAIAREEQEMDFMAQWQRLQVEQTLERQRRFMELERAQFQQLQQPAMPAAIPPPAREREAEHGPDTEALAE
jgi:hypothetical protein